MSNQSLSFVISATTVGSPRVDSIQRNVTVVSQKYVTYWSCDSVSNQVLSFVISATTVGSPRVDSIQRNVSVVSQKYICHILEL